MSGIEISKRLVLINSASSAVALVLNISILVWLQQYLLKRISPEEYSLIPILMAVMAIAPLFTTILTSGLGRYVTVAYARGDNEEVARICSTMFPIMLVAGVLFIAVGWIGAWQIDSLLNIPPELIHDAQIMMAMLFFSTGLRLPLSVFGSGFMVRQKLMLQDMIDVGCQFLRIALLFTLLFGVSTRVLWVTTAMVVTELVNLAITTPVSMFLAPSLRVRWGVFSWPLFKEITSFGGWGFLNQIGESLKQSMDALILNRFASAVEVSVFYVAGIAPRQLLLMVGPITRPFIPVLAAMSATGDFVRLRNTYLRTARYHAWLILSVAVPAIIYSNEVMHLYLGGMYDDAGGVMAILIAVNVLNSFNALGPAVVAASGNMRGLAVRMLAIHLLNLILTLIFVAYLQKGAYGSAIATLMAVAFFEAAFVWPLCRKAAHTPMLLWVREMVLPSLGSALPSILLCLTVKMTIGVNTWLELIMISALSAVLHFSVVVSFGLRKQDRIDLGKIADRLHGPAKTMVRYFAEK